MNTLTGLFQTIVLPALATLQRPNALSNAMLRKIYVDPELGGGVGVGQTVNVNIPTVDRNNVSNIGNGELNPQDRTHTTVSITVSHNESDSCVIRDFDQVRTPVAFRDFYLASLIEEVTQKVDLAACSLVTSAKFNSYSSITAGADTFSRANIASAWANLVGAGVPTNPGEFHFCTGHVPFGNMTTDSTWINESTVGLTAAESVQQRAMFARAYNAIIDYDPLFPQPSAGATYAGLLFHKNAIAMKVVRPPKSMGTAVMETYFTVPGTQIVYRIQFWYEPMKQGYILHVQCMFGIEAVRPDYGSYLVTT